MAERIIMPKQGLQMTEGTITEWCVQEGGKVIAGKPLFVMETDKLSITIDAEVSGTLLKIVRGEGETVPITETIAIVGEPGEDISLTEKSPQTEETKGEDVKQDSGETKQVSAPECVQEGRVFITPRAKMRAEELQIDYTNLKGSAPDGTIIQRDILNAKDAMPQSLPARAGAAISNAGDKPADAQHPKTPAFIDVPSDEKTVIPMRGMRRVIADRMKQSLSTNAQTTHVISVRMDQARQMREAFKGTIGYNDLIAYAASRALRDFPQINAELTEEGIWRKDFVNLGIAVSLDDGLIVPVVKNADQLTLSALSAQIKALAKRAREGMLQPDEYEGGTFTVSNLGMFGLEEFVAIINPPEAGILAVGKITDTPIAVDGQIEIHSVMKLTLSYDHRVVDGAPAAQFLSQIKKYLENPYELL